MIKELICAVALSGTIGMTAPQNSNDGTYYQDVTISETYEYETNEVNSESDLVVGNIYKLEIPYSINNMVAFNCSKVYSINYISLESRQLRIYTINNYLRTQIILNPTGNYFYDIGLSYSPTLIYYCVYGLDETLNNSNILPYISASDYLGEKTITITPKEFNGLFSIFDNFLHERLFSGGILDSTNVTVFNATMSLGQWLSTTTSIVLLCLIVLLLILLIKFIFKYVGGMMIWRS